MSYVIVIVYDQEDEASKARQSIKSLEKEGRISLDDAAVITKDADDKVHVKNEMDRDVGIGLLGGSLVGLLIAGIFFPIAGILIGALGGGLIGKMVSNGVDKKFIKDVQEAMKPGNSALFLVIKSNDPGMAVEALRQYKGGTIFHSSLDDDVEKELRDSIK